MMRKADPQSPLLLIPGPVEVAEEIQQAACRPMIGHRGPEISELLSALLPRVQKFLGTESSIYPLAASASAVMEASVRNAAPGPFLHLVCGAFSQRWSQIRQACGLQGDELAVDWGKANRGVALEEALSKKHYRAVTLVHNETSTGVLNPLAEIAEIVNRQDDCLLLVDAVSSMAATSLDLDKNNVDVCFAGSQKAWALPAGLTLCAVSPRALRRSEEAPSTGFALDWMTHEKSMQKWQTPTTPPLSLLFQLEKQMQRIETEGFEARYHRHCAMRDQLLQWAEGKFQPFAEEGYRSPSVTTLSADTKYLAHFLKAMREQGYVIGPGYGKTKANLFRIGHMGEWDTSSLAVALACMDEQWLKVQKGNS